MMTTRMSEGKIGCAVASWQHASQSEQNARGPRWIRERAALKIRREGEREHVARLTRHTAGLS
jgi:hypothetical protein